MIGQNAGQSGSQKVDATNSIAIGYGTYTTKDNQIVLGNSSTVETDLQGNVLISSLTAGGIVKSDVTTGQLQVATPGADYLTPLDSTFSGNHLILGIYHIWVDSTGNLRIKGSVPTSDADGTVVGAQS
jgi:hypothetical protein